MGAVPSTPRGDGNPADHGDYLLGALVGEKSFDLSSNLWERLLALPLALHWSDKAIKEACERLAQNSRFTGHLAKLLLHSAWSLQAASTETPSSVSTFVKATNSIRFSSVFLKHFIEHTSYGQLMACLSLSLNEKEADASGLSQGNQNVAFVVVSALLSFIGSTDVNPSTYWLHLEVVNLLLVMMSTQLYSGTKETHMFLEAAMKQDRMHVAIIVRKLLTSFIAKLPIPADVAPYMTSNRVNQQGVLQRVGSAAVTVLRLPYYTYSYLMRPNSASVLSPLAQNSLLLLLVLVHYRKVISEEDSNVRGLINENGNDALPGSQEAVMNPFCQALELTRDTEFDLVDVENNAQGGSIARVPFAALYDTLGLCLMDESSILLLYSLVHGNSAFLEYVLVRSDLDTLLMPLMEMLYDAPRKTPKQIYMLLIILLILSQDASFNVCIHKLVLPGVPWYKERLLTHTTLGSLMVVILIRTVNYNHSKLRDVYLHTNCLAVLSNMAPHVHKLNAYAAQRLVSLFDMLSRKYIKLADLSKSLKGKTNGIDVGEDVPTDLHIYTDFLRIVLEIINAILTFALPHNPEVIYALLHRQELFEPFRNNPRFFELTENLYTVLEFFNARMDAQKNEGEWSVERVLQLIIANTRSWRGEGMKVCTQLCFTYEEELHPEEFFVPYVWQLVVFNSGIAWDMDTITLFPSRPIVEIDRSESFNDKGFEMPVTPGAEV